VLLGPYHKYSWRHLSGRPPKCRWKAWCVVNFPLLMCTHLDVFLQNLECLTKSAIMKKFQELWQRKWLNSILAESQYLYFQEWHILGNIPLRTPYDLLCFSSFVDYCSNKSHPTECMIKRREKRQRVQQRGMAWEWRLQNQICRHTLCVHMKTVDRCPTKQWVTKVGSVNYGCAH